VQSPFISSDRAIGALVVCGLFLAPKAAALEAAAGDQPGPRAFLAAMIAVLFAYGGWATATFVSGEIKDSARTLPRALILGTAGVVALYLGVNAACLAALGPGGLATFDAPASEVMRRALGPPGATAIAAAIAVSSGFLAQGLLHVPVYFAMARDGLFFERRSHPPEDHRCLTSPSRSKACSRSRPRFRGRTKRS
jgi:APA family basic amino acid/polyamine antiporter